MKHDLAEKWDERLRDLQAQSAREPANIMIWHWRGEARVLRFLLHRYGEIAPPASVEQATVAAVPGDAATAEVSALERSLLRLALLIPIVANKHSRPAPRERAEILERIKIARDEGRAIEDEDEVLWEDVSANIRRNMMQLRERQCNREARWKRIQREGEEEREQRRKK